jgi:hypothetical protein
VLFEPVDFPAVSFCNLNNIMASKLELGGPYLINVLFDIENDQYAAATGQSVDTVRRRRAAVLGKSPWVLEKTYNVSSSADGGHGQWHSRVKRGR